MKKKLQRYFALTDKGINNVLKASRLSFFKYFTFLFTPSLVFLFLQDYMNQSLKPLTIYMTILAMIVFVLYFALSREYTQTYDVTYQESVDLRVDIANKLRDLPLSYFSKHNLSDLSQTIMMDVNNLEMTISHAVPQGIGFFFFFIVVSIMLVINNPILGLCVIMPIWFTIAIMFLTKDSQMKHISKYYNRLLENSAAFQEAFEMQQEIKSYSMQKEIEEDVLNRLEDTEKIHIKSEFRMATMSSLVGILPYLAPVLTAIIGAIQFSTGNISVLYYVGYLMAATNISSQYAGLNEFLIMMFFFKDSFTRIRDLKEEPTQNGTDVKFNNFDISIENVDFSYGENKIINGVSFLAKQGEVTALVGPSGCGKTTMLRLISRLYDYDKGLISIGGKDIKEISTKSLFENISIVFQNVELFNATVFENIKIGREDATDEEVLQAAKLANVDKMVEKFSDGFNTMIGENGSKLSGGERQRISIARAFLKNSPIILLDEISASIDVENEKEIQKSINKLIENKTVLVISHRLKSIEKVDKIVVMNNGKIDSIGKHEELLNESILYKSMIQKSELTDEYVY